MADQPISQLPIAGTLSGNEVTVVVQGGVTKQVQVSAIANAISPGKLITSVSLTTGYYLIFFYSDGSTSTTGPIPGYVSATINGSGHLILTSTTGATTDCGNVVGPQGPTGPTGPAGTAATIAAGTATTLPYGSTPTVTNTGSSSAATFDFGIPAGAPGATGTFSGGTTGFTPNTPTSGAVVLGGTLNVSNGGTGAVTLTGYVKGNGTSAMTASSTIPTTDLSGTITNAQLANSAITINGTSTSLGGSINVGTVTSVTGTSPVVSSGGATPAISIPAASTSVSGYLTSTDWNTFNSKQPAGTYVTSVSGTGSVNGITLTGTVTSTGSLTLGGTLSGIGNSQLTNSSITINGSSVSLGGSTTVTATASNALTIGTGLTGTSYDGSTPVTIAIDGTVATLTGGQTLTNKTISGASNTLTNIGNSSLTNSSITLGTTNIALGGTSLTPAGLTSVTVTQNPTSDLQLATKQYVDGLVATGLTYHEPVQATTTASLASTTGGTVTYNAPGPEGVGATITLSVALTVLDGYTLLNTNRILVKNEVNQAYNGIYTWATGGTVLTRATDADTYGTAVNQLSQNDYFFTQNGTVNKGTSYVVTTVGTINFTTTAITFAEFSSSLVYTAGTGLTLTGTQFSISNVGTAGTYGSSTLIPVITTNAQGQVTNVTTAANPQGTVTSVAATGGTGISVTGSPITSSGTLNITNTAPDQTVVFTNGTGISVTGTYPSFTVTNTSPSSGGTVTSVSGTTGRITSTGGVTPVIDLASGVATAGTTGSATLIPVVTIDTYGRVTSITTAANPQGTVTSVSGTGTVSGISLSGTVTSTGNLTLGGTLDLSSPPVIGGTAPAAITGTTITATKYVGVSGGTF